ncbi:MAG: S9 family peptidase [Myxococcota bacterium]|nr:S9 family peptidase [Myxococcota bacterium]
MKVRALTHSSAALACLLALLACEVPKGPEGVKPGQESPETKRLTEQQPECAKLCSHALDCVMGQDAELEAVRGTQAYQEGWTDCVYECQHTLDDAQRACWTEAACDSLPSAQGLAKQTCPGMSAKSEPVTSPEPEPKEEPVTEPTAVAEPVAAASTPDPAAQLLASAEPQPFSALAMWAMQRISESTLSPDGKWVAFTLRKTDFEANKGVFDLWLVGVDGQGLKQFTKDPARDTTPQWSADGKSIYFLSNRSGSSQIWKQAVEGGEAEQVSQLPLDVSDLKPSPDGNYLAFSAEVFPGTSIEETAARLEEEKKKKTTGKAYDRIFVRHWDTWKDGRRKHLFVLSLADGAVVDVLKDMDVDAPSKPFGGSEEFEFTPDGKGIVFSARDAGPEEPWSTNFDLYLAPLDGSAAPKILTADNPAWDTQPRFSPDGSTLAWLAMSRAGYEADRFRIMVRAWPDGEARELAPSWDRSPHTLEWAADGQSLVVEAQNLGHSSLFRIALADGAVSTLVAEGSVSAFSVGATQIVYGLNHLRSPVELYAIDLAGGEPKTITEINKPLLEKLKMGEPEQFTFQGANNDTVYAWVVKPIDFDPNKKYPVAYLIHGGPQGSFGNDFHYRWNPQAYAGAGYAAVMVDFHGSTGYGQAFTDSIQGDWGGKPFEDLQKGLAAAIERYPWMDGERVAALGASYGGYMINWIAGNWPDRFRALVVHDGNLDERAAYFNTEELWFPEWDHMGTPWTNPEGYEKHNPVHHISKWKTPMLVIHGGQDFRVVETQGIGTFNAAQRMGVPSRFLYFPDENHWVLSPANGLLWHQEVLAWLDRWTKP